MIELSFLMGFRKLRILLEQLVIFLKSWLFTETKLLSEFPTLELEFQRLQEIEIVNAFLEKIEGIYNIKRGNISCVL